MEAVQTKPEPKLVICRDTWHYKYYCFIHNQWGFQIPARTSLCPYCQSMFWGSVSIVVLGPIILLGWVIVKLARQLCKLISKSEKLTWAAGVFETQWGANLVEDAPKAMEESFALVGLMVGMVGLIALAAGFAVVTVLSFGIWKIILSIPQWPYAIWCAICAVGDFIANAVCYIGWTIFSVLGLIGYGMHYTALGCVYAWNGVTWFFTNGPLWTLIGLWVAGIAGGLLASAILCYIIYKIVTTKEFASVANWVLMKLNGFAEAKAVVSVRYAAYRRRRENAWWERKRARDNRPKKVRKPNRLLTWLGAKLGDLFSRDIHVGESAAKAIGPFTILWRYLWAIKKGVCPLVEFMDASQVSDKPENIP